MRGIERACKKTVIPQVLEKVKDRKLRYLNLKFQNMHNGKPLVNPRLRPGVGWVKGRWS